jgi:hypothetical protein
VSGYETRRLQDVDAVRFWRPVRRELGVQAFGVNARTGDEGAELIVAHDESSSGHEELYFVVEGTATFSVADDTFTAPAGMLVFVRDPELRRGAVAATAGTTILTVAKPGEPYAPPAWEVNAEAFPYFDAGEYGRAKAVLERALDERGETAGLLYNIACAESCSATPTEHLNTCCARWSWTHSTRTSRNKTRTSTSSETTSGFRARTRATLEASPADPAGLVRSPPRTWDSLTSHRGRVEQTLLRQVEEKRGRLALRQDERRASRRLSDTRRISEPLPAPRRYPHDLCIRLAGSQRHRDLP